MCFISEVFNIFFVFANYFLHYFDYQTYCYDTNPNNPYRQLEKCQHYGFLHDGTTHWATGINTVFVRVVNDDGTVYKVPFSMKDVPGSFTGEVLCSELIYEISSIKMIKNSAADKIIEALKSYKSTGNDGSKNEYRKLHLQLKVYHI